MAAREEAETVIAVMGASGNVGSKTLEVLLGRKQEVRALEHEAKLGAAGERGVEVVVGDATDADDLRLLFKDVDAALVLLPDVVADPDFRATRRAMVAAITASLETARVEHVVMLSAVDAGTPDAAGPAADLYAFEQSLFALPRTHVLALRATFHMENLLAALPLVRSQRMNGGALDPDLAFPMIATVDIAREAADRLVRRDFEGREVRFLLGPEDVSMNEATQALGAALGIPDLPYVQFPPAGVKQALMDAGMSEEGASAVVDLYEAINEGRAFEGVRRTAETTTPTRLEDFLAAALPR